MTRFALGHYLLAATGRPALLMEALRKYRHRRARLGMGRRAPALTLPAGPGLPAADLVAGLARTRAVLRLEEAGARQWIGVADVDFPAAVDALQGAWPDSVRVAPSPDGFASLRREGGDRIDVERYDQRGPGHWVSANTANDVARALYRDWFAEPGLHEVAAVLGGPTADQRRDAMPVDVVCTWSSHEDPDWRRMYDDHVRDYSGATDAASMTRFTSNDELRYVLRSMAANLPWVRHIHLVSNCAPPDWLDLSRPGLSWVDHAAILPPDALPTFNSHAVETALQRIPGLTEHFIYANDDMFACRPMDKARFFAANGASRTFLEPYAMVTGPVTRGAQDYLNASRNSAALIREAFGTVPVRLHRHVPYALRRSVLEEISARFPGAMARTRANRFRGMDDVNTTSFLYHHYALHTGMAQEGSAEVAFVQSSDLRWRDQIAGVGSGQCDFLCLNEGGTAESGPDWRRQTQRVLRRLFPDPAPWERA